MLLAENARLTGGQSPKRHWAGTNARHPAGHLNCRYELRASSQTPSNEVPRYGVELYLGRLLVSVRLAARSSQRPLSVTETRP